MQRRVCVVCEVQPVIQLGSSSGFCPGTGPVGASLNSCSEQILFSRPLLPGQMLCPLLPQGQLGFPHLLQHLPPTVFFLPRGTLLILATAACVPLWSPAGRVPARSSEPHRQGHPQTNRQGHLQTDRRAGERGERQIYVHSPMAQ